MVAYKPKKEQNTDEPEKEYVVIGWIKPVVNKDGIIHNKYLRVEINGIISIDTIEKMLAGEVRGIPIKTTQVKQKVRD